MQNNRRGTRHIALLLIGSLGLSACATSVAGTEGQGLSDNQRVLRTETANFNQTVAVPALLGALAGAGLGAALCRKNKAACAGGGAAAGGLLGAGAGYLVAQKNTQAASKEEALRIRIEAAQEDIARFDKVIAATDGVIAQHRQAVALMKASYRKGEVNLASARQERENLSGDIQSVRQAIAACEARITAINADLKHYGSEGSQLAIQRDRLAKKRLDLEDQLKKLLGIEQGVPTS